MKIAVCLKQVPSTETKIKCISSNKQDNVSVQQQDSSQIDTRDIKWIISPYDEYAIEEALQVQSQKSGSTVTAISFGPKSRVIKALQMALAMGVDEAVCIIDSDDSSIGLADSLVVAKLLFKCIERVGPFDLIFMGKTAIDDNQSAVGPMLAGLLNIPHASFVSKLEYHERKVVLERDIEGGAKEVIEMQLPAIIGATKGLNNPRYATLPGIMKAKRKPFTEMTSDSLGIDIEKTSVEYADFRLPPERPVVQMIEGDVTEQATELVRLLKYKEKVL